MGRPLSGITYDLGSEHVRDRLLFFAIQKLLDSPIVSGVAEHQQYAVLSQRLALDTNTSAYASASPIDNKPEVDIQPYQSLRRHTYGTYVCVRGDWRRN
ncbi:hypothetical protein BJV78DRAFT_911323 [Lactifluus subvellereus]|nr:hypothetical protein BJV78DRAFT_911323 [Lactifluus subvellereus]